VSVVQNLLGDTYKQSDTFFMGCMGWKDNLEVLRIKGPERREQEKSSSDHDLSGCVRGGHVKRELHFNWPFSQEGRHKGAVGRLSRRRRKEGRISKWMRINFLVGQMSVGTAHWCEDIEERNGWSSREEELYREGG